MNQELRNNIRKVHNNQKIKWEQQFPSVYGEKHFTANNVRNINLAIRELRKFPLTAVRKEAEKMNLMYLISQNSHDGKWGIDKKNTPEGGGVIAQAESYTRCILRARDEYGIHPIFIYGVGLDGF